MYQQGCGVAGISAAAVGMLPQTGEAGNILKVIGILLIIGIVLTQAIVFFLKKRVSNVY
ncbi:LPXTG cell wall anchor domain-containing protein [Tetragenococcus koreensis]|uniref:LPXTG cell wall anchor domain-containing protein n=1 Tax=Tetragenococcus koreensis TaxID=290335 RepID=UPI001F25DDB9|nr:LPXTG cell wall anchor domain-containing protein [Tetragenococcus koreensis]MCF1585650.1 LPXTG cell wall anchor domain-containing protein [Tetragenococcus koreensis]MCF1615284.1 LPXTG cell wall anchor domain-containing protein [Tetragenococcus koreensis]MCF1617420.1 LPXTG cell wall anchor domain-containing protein [Tetragenococcus koreensis]MCF1620295.1 LPXTG cell wall anchor domain-containing protein [Tetragenococcus koreensis]MCF1621769.1 LPXTG cell wall anchor domain-containing protein [